MAYLALGVEVYPNGLEHHQPRRLSESAVPHIKPKLMEYYLGVIAGVLLLQHTVPAQSEGSIIIMILGFYRLNLPLLRVDLSVYLGSFVATRSGFNGAA